MRSVGAASLGGVVADMFVRNDLPLGSMCSGLITTAATLLPWPTRGQFSNSVLQYKGEHPISQPTPPARRGVFYQADLSGYSRQ
jgi:hypothetical protein